MITVDEILVVASVVDADNVVTSDALVTTVDGLPLVVFNAVETAPVDVPTVAGVSLVISDVDRVPVISVETVAANDDISVELGSETDTSKDHNEEYSQNEDGWPTLVSVQPDVR